MWEIVCHGHKASVAIATIPMGCSRWGIDFARSHGSIVNQWLVACAPKEISVKNL